MPNQYRPDKKTVGELLSTTNPPIVVPNWQRSYSWTTTEVETFWRDLLAFDTQYPGNSIMGQEYFLGSVVIVNATDDHLLLDGQQRLSTAAILLSVIRDFLTRYNQDAATRTQARYLGDFDDPRNEYKYKVTMNEYDRDFFKRKVLEPRDAAYRDPEPTLTSHRLISSAREFFENQFESKYDELGHPDEAARWSLRIQFVLTGHMSVVAIFSQDEDNAAAVFETLNDRGIGLSTADLVRNLLLRRAAAPSRTEIIDLWGEILEVEGDAPLKTFLRHYWVSHYGDVKTLSLYREMKAKIVNENLDSLALSRKLRDGASIYRDIVAAQADDEEVARLLTDVDTLAATLLYPTILSAWEELPVEELRRVLRALLVIFIRHSVIGQLENSRLENVLYRIARELRAGRPVEDVLQNLREFAPDAEAFKAAFSVAVIPRRATARYLLRQLELDRRTTEELDVGPSDKVHVEHVYPQTPLLAHRLERHGQLVDRLGNQTLLAKRLNTAIKNSPFEVKKPRYTESELLITRDIISYDKWTEEEINQRQHRLAERAQAIWAFPVS